MLLSGKKWVGRSGFLLLFFFFFFLLFFFLYVCCFFFFCCCFLLLLFCCCCFCCFVVVVLFIYLFFYLLCFVLFCLFVFFCCCFCSLFFCFLFCFFVSATKTTEMRILAVIMQHQHKFCVYKGKRKLKLLIACEIFVLFVHQQFLSCRKYGKKITIVGLGGLGGRGLERVGRVTVNITSSFFLASGTPDKTGAQSDFTPFTTAHCFLKQRKESIRFNVLPPIP